MPEVAAAPFWSDKSRCVLVFPCLQLQIAYHSHCQNHMSTVKNVR
jgi:hypothetical protein